MWKWDLKFLGLSGCTQRHFESFLNGPKKIEDNFEVKSKDFGQMEGGKMLEMFKFHSLEVVKLRETRHQVKWMSQSKPQI